MRLLVLDNYDSFTWNLVQLLESGGAECVVRRSDAISLAEIGALHPDGIVLSPGPYGPERTGVCRQAVRRFSSDVPVLGVCLGMQVIASVAGARVAASGRPVHGKTSPILHQGEGVLRGLPSPFLAARYHSLHVVPESVPEGLEVTARTADGTIMACRMRGRRAEGVQFHPESFLTAYGPGLLGNFLEDCAA